LIEEKERTPVGHVPGLGAVVVRVPTRTPSSYAVIRIVADESQPYSSGEYMMEISLRSLEKVIPKSAP